MISTRGWAVASTAAAIVASGCSSDSGGPVVATKSALVVYIVDGIAIGQTVAPVAGAKVFVETPDGPIVATSEADGRAVLEGITFGEHGVTVTAYAAGHALQSLVEVTPESAGKIAQVAYPTAGKELVIPLEKPRALEALVPLTGALTSKLAADNFVTLTSSPGGEGYEGITSEYFVGVPKGKPLTLIALEWSIDSVIPTNGYAETKHRWVLWNEAPQPGPGTVPLDFSTGTRLTPTKVNVTLVAPAGYEPGKPEPPAWQVFEIKSGGPFPLMGSRSRAESADGKVWTCPGEHVVVPGVLPVTIAIFPGFEGSVSIRQNEGAISDGTKVDDFMPFAPTPPDTPINGSIDLGAVDPGAGVVALQILDGVGPRSTLAWNIASVRGQSLPKSFKLPVLPADAMAMIPPRPKGRLLQLAGSLSPTYPFIAGRIGGGRFFDVTR
jgi:hypothetical protein